jgi:beta-glucosidase-like glycosyl hydrolase
VQASREATLQNARESITLLKNTNNLLPLPIGTKLVVTGPNADCMAGQLGGWSVHTIMAGLVQAVQAVVGEVSA